MPPLLGWVLRLSLLAGVWVYALNYAPFPLSIAGYDMQPREELAALLGLSALLVLYPALVACACPTPLFHRAVKRVKSHGASE